MMAYYKKSFKDYDDDENVGVSAWHSSSLIARRMHEFYLSFARLWRRGEFLEGNDVLDLIWGEMYADSTKDQKETMDVVDAGLSKCSCNMRLAKKKADYLKAKEQLAMGVKKKFYFLKEMEKQQGLGKNYKDEYEDDFD